MTRHTTGDGRLAFQIDPTLSHTTGPDSYQVSSYTIVPCPMIRMLSDRIWRDSIDRPPIEERIARKTAPGVVTWCNPTETGELLGLLVEARAEIMRLKGAQP